jgi:hypothetical protein
VCVCVCVCVCVYAYMYIYIYILIEEAFVCGSFFLVLKLTNNRKEIAKDSKRILYHTVSRRDQRNGVVKNSF